MGDTALYVECLYHVRTGTLQKETDEQTDRQTDRQIESRNSSLSVLVSVFSNLRTRTPFQKLMAAQLQFCSLKRSQEGKETRPRQRVTGTKKDTVRKDRLNNESRNKKKIKMRTALDVIHRIQWDDNLPEECFTIGYEDRFEGIQVNLVQCKIGF